MRAPDLPARANHPRLAGEDHEHRLARLTLLDDRPPRPELDHIGLPRQASEMRFENPSNSGTAARADDGSPERRVGSVPRNGACPATTGGPILASGPLASRERTPPPHLVQGGSACGGIVMRMDARSRLEALMAERILVLEGPKGTAIQALELSEEDFRGDLLKDHPRDVRGDNDLLGLTRPDIVEAIHRDYVAAGAWIVSTNTFNASPVSQSEYGLEHLVYEMNKAAAETARRALDGADDRFVVGSVGPTNRTLSISPKVEDPGVPDDHLRRAHGRVRGADPGPGGRRRRRAPDRDDLRHLNAKAAIAAAEDVAPDTPLWLSFTAVDQSGRNLSGQTAEAFWLSIEHAEPMIVGVNCSLGAAQMRPYLEALSRIAPTYTACYPNAGLPNAFGPARRGPGDHQRLRRRVRSRRTRQRPRRVLRDHARSTSDRSRTPSAICRPREVPAPAETFTSFSGLEPFVVRPDTGFVMVGERQNITGSKKFRRLIESGDFQAAVDIAREQVQNGANLLDVNMDTDLLDGPQAMTTYLNLLATEPEVARVPIMVDSSSWDVIEAGLKCVQGKGVVNSISLKEGEEDFLAKARRVKRYGAAVVVMAFDQQGQADTVERKVEICERAYRLLTEQAGYDPSDIIFDPNILAIATGMEEHADFAKAFIDATRIIKRRLPGREGLGRRLEPLVRLPRERRRPRGDALGVPVPRAPGRARHGDRERGPAPGLRRHPEGPQGARRGPDLQPARGRDRADAHLRADRHGRGDADRAGPDVAGRLRRGAALARARPRHRRLHRGGRGGGEAAASSGRSR